MIFIRMILLIYQIHELNLYLKKTQANIYIYIFIYIYITQY